VPAFDHGNGWLLPEDTGKRPRAAYRPEGTVTIWGNPQKQKQLAAD
jgi:hypothetical protein